MTAPDIMPLSPPDPLFVTQTIRVGTAGWSIPRQHSAFFAGEGSHLERYANLLNCAEINSSFYRPHRRATYARWAAATPEAFRFSVKAPKTITHECGMAPDRAAVATFLDEVRCLGGKLGPILFQLPPRQDFDGSRARAFLAMFRDLYPAGAAAFEPRHPAWFSPLADALLREFRIARVAADPALAAEASRPAGYSGLRYFRLHGSPRMYYSSYSAGYIEQLARTFHASESGCDLWCIFDNTASGTAIENALTLARTLALRFASSSR